MPETKDKLDEAQKFVFFVLPSENLRCRNCSVMITNERAIIKVYKNYQTAEHTICPKQ